MNGVEVMLCMMIKVLLRMVMIEAVPEGGKEDAVSHWERQSQFLFCKIRMMKMTMIMMIKMIMMMRRMISHWLRRS